MIILHHSWIMIILHILSFVSSHFIIHMWIEFSIESWSKLSDWKSGKNLLIWLLSWVENPLDPICLSKESRVNNTGSKSISKLCQTSEAPSQKVQTLFDVTTLEGKLPVFWNHSWFAQMHKHSCGNILMF